MDLDARPYRCFLMVAEEQSFSRAAVRLNISQPALSAQIREFERRLGFDLFVRTSRRVELSGQGRLFLGNARRYVNEATIIGRAARDIRTNEIRIGAALHTVLIPERTRLVERFIRANPDVPLQILNDSDSRSLIRLGRREIDLVISVEPRPEAAHTPSAARLMEDALFPDLERLVVRERPIELLLPAESRLASDETVSLAALKGLQIVIPGRFHGLALSEAIYYRLRDAGADLVRPPEGNAIAVEQYARLKRMAAVTLGWFAYPGPDPVDMVRRPVAGLRLSTCLMLARLQAEQRPAAARFWQAAQDGAES